MCHHNNFVVAPCRTCLHRRAVRTLDLFMSVVFCPALLRAVSVLVNILHFTYEAAACVGPAQLNVVSPLRVLWQNTAHPSSAREPTRHNFTL